jgi:hypothetical protein
MTRNDTLGLCSGHAFDNSIYSMQCEQHSKHNLRASHSQSRTFSGSIRHATVSDTLNGSCMYIQAPTELLLDLPTSDKSSNDITYLISDLVKFH